MSLKSHPVYSLFERLVDPLVDAPVERPPDTLLAFYLHYMKPVKGALALTVLGSFLTAVTDLLLFVFIGWIVDWIATGDRAGFFSEHGFALTLIAAFILVGRPLVVLFARGMASLAVSPGLTNMVRWRTHRYVLRQSLSFFQNDFAGRIAQKVTQTSARLRETVLSVIDGVFFLAVFLLGTIGLFADLDWRLALVVALWAVGYAAVIVVLVPPVRAKSAALSELTSTLSGRIVDSYTNIVSVKLFAHAGREDDYARESISWHTDAFRTLSRATLTMTVSLTLLNGVLIVAAGGVSLWLWSEGAISAGAVALALGLITRINQMSNWVLRTVTSLFEDIGTVENGIETISRPIRVTDRPDAVPLVVTEGQVRFERVTFAYDSGAEPVIRDLDLTIRPGEKVGLVGPSGAGKTTLVNLLLRMYDLTDGRILIDGQDISSVTQESLRRAIGVVTQEPSLLHRSIRANIAYGRAEASEEAVRAAAARAEALGFIAGLRDPKGRRGFDAYAGERGVKLSGGQRQRIAIARVMLKDAPILVLDEATSALDSEVEAAIQDNLARLMEGKTVVAIAHRLSTIAAMDRLVVMDAGRIVEEGAHAALLRRGGLYARLWSRQSGGFLGDGRGPRLEEAV